MFFLLVVDQGIGWQSGEDMPEPCFFACSPEACGYVGLAYFAMTRVVGVKMLWHARVLLPDGSVYSGMGTLRSRQRGALSFMLIRRVNDVGSSLFRNSADLRMMCM